MEFPPNILYLFLFIYFFWSAVSQFGLFKTLFSQETPKSLP